MSSYAEERQSKKERETAGRERGEGAGAENMGAKRERRPVAQLLLLLLQDGKRTMCWSPDGLSGERALALLRWASAFRPARCNYGAESQQSRLASANAE